MTRNYSPYYRKKRRHKYPDLYPVEVLKRVDRPTTIIHDEQVPQLDEREGGFSRAGRGDFGEQIAKEYRRFVPKHPLSGALVSMAGILADVVDAPEILEKLKLPGILYPNRRPGAP